MNPTYRAAMQYRELGYHFYPAYPGTKTPHFGLLPRKPNPHWFVGCDEKITGKRYIPFWDRYREHMPSKGECNKWFNRDPVPNIVFITGVNGHTVFDLDTIEADIIVAGKGIPPCPEVESRRGRHLHFQHHGEKLKYDFMSGAELLGPGRCCTAPPSVHEKGHVYHWKPGYELPPVSDLPPLPNWIVKAARMPVAPPRAFTPPVGDSDAERRFGRILDKLRATSERRNDATNKAAFCAKELIPYLGIENVIDRIVEVAVSLGLPEREASSVVRRKLGAL